MLLIFLVTFFSPLFKTGLGLPEARFSRVRELSGHKYKDDYKVFIDATATGIPVTKLERPLFSWDFMPSSKKSNTTYTTKPESEEGNHNNERLSKPIQNGGKVRWRKRKNRNNLRDSEEKKTNKHLRNQKRIREMNITNINNNNRNTPRDSKERKRKSKNKKNKQDRKNSKQENNFAGKNKRNKMDRKVKRGRKQKEKHIHNNELPDSVYSVKPQVFTTEEVNLETPFGKASTIMKKTEDDQLTQVHHHQVYTRDHKTNESNSILDAKSSSQGMNESNISNVGEDNTLQPILLTDLTSIDHIKINIDKNDSSVSHEDSTNKMDFRESESAREEIDINNSSSIYFKFSLENKTNNHQNSLFSVSTSEFGNGDRSSSDHDVEENDALNEVTGDISCITGTFLPAPPSPHSSIRYVRTQTASTTRLIAEYVCDTKYHLNKPKIYQVICSERKWMGTVPSCTPELNTTTDILAACHNGKGSCDHICEVIGNNTICTCYKGFRLQNGVCKDINECEMENGGCENGCRNTPGSHHCTCPPGLRLGDNHMNCIDINECLLRNGHGPCQDSCLNKWRGYECSCNGITGTRLAADNHTCQDIDECADGTAGCSHTCLNTFGSAFCLCPSGFMLGDDWKTCQDIDECSNDELQADQCEFGCVNTIGSYHCLGSQNDDSMPLPTTEILTACPVGFYLDAEGRCKDVDECIESISGCEQGCLNTHGNFQCYCGLGYKLAADNKTCIESKEAVCPPLESPLQGYWECARHLIRTKKSKFPWMKRTRVVNHAGAICQLRCPPGYVLEGGYHKACGQDSKWKGPEDGTCVRKLDYMFNVILKA